MSKLIKFTYPCQRDDCEGTAAAKMLDLNQAEDAKVIEVDIEMAISQMELLCDGCDATYYTGDIEVLSGDQL